MMHQKSYTVFLYQNNKVLPCLCLFFILRNREILSSHFSQIGWCIRINHTHPTILWNPRVYFDLIAFSQCFSILLFPPFFHSTVTTILLSSTLKQILLPYMKDNIEFAFLYLAYFASHLSLSFIHFDGNGGILLL